MIKKEERITRFPENKQVELSVISMLLKHISNVEKAQVFELKEDDFYDTNCKNVFKAIMSLKKVNSYIDINTVFNKLKELKINIEYQSLVQLISVKIESSYLLEDYVVILKDLSKERSLLEIADTIKEIAHFGDKTTSEKYNEIVNMFNNTSTALTNNIQEEKTAFLSFISNLENRIEMGDSINNTWGLKDLDEECGGIQPDLFIVAAPPGGFKTSYLDIIINKNAKKGKRVMFFSTEMTTEQVLLRKIQRELGISSNKIRKGQVSKEELSIIKSFEKDLSENIVYDQTSSIDVDMIKIKAKMENQKRKLDLICIDYLQLCSCKRVKNNRVEEVAEISRQLKALSKELNIPVIALSQLNRNYSNRADGKPVMADLKESSQIEQDAGAIIFLNVSNNSDKPTNRYDVPERMEIVIAKNRYGCMKTFQAELIRSRLTIRDIQEETPRFLNSKNWNNNGIDEEDDNPFDKEDNYDNRLF